MRGYPLVSLDLPPVPRLTNSSSTPDNGLVVTQATPTPTPSWVQPVLGRTYHTVPLQERIQGVGSYSTKQTGGCRVGWVDRRGGPVRACRGRDRTRGLETGERGGEARRRWLWKICRRRGEELRGAEVTEDRSSGAGSVEGKQGEGGSHQQVVEEVVSERRYMSIWGASRLEAEFGES
eukprot:765380-Hanusia_phi.AAC.1